MSKQNQPRSSNKSGARSRLSRIPLGVERERCLEACGGSCSLSGLAALERLGGTSICERKAQDENGDSQRVRRNPDFRRVSPVGYKYHVSLRRKWTGICSESIHGRDTADVLCFCRWGNTSVGNTAVDAMTQKSGVTLFYEGVSPHKLALLRELVCEVWERARCFYLFGEHLLDRVSLAVPVHSGCGVGCACFPPPGFVMCACVMLIAAGSVSQARWQWHPSSNRSLSEGFQASAPA